MKRTTLRSPTATPTVDNDVNPSTSKRISKETTQLRSNRTPRHPTGKSANHQDDDGWKTVEKPSLGQVFGSAKTTRFKFRLHVHMALKNNEHQGFINVPKVQKEFCSELFKADASTNILKWHDEEQQLSQKSNPITTASQIPTDRKNLSEWIAGTSSMTARNNTQILKFFLYLETSTSYSLLKKTMKPWLDTNHHKIFATNLSSTNNRLLAWIKDSHPDWTRLDDLRKKLQEVVINNSECTTCELDLRPRRTRIGQGPHAIFIWAIGITCSLSKVNCYMHALLQGLSKKSDVPANLKHIQIIPFNPIQGLISNDTLTALANAHDIKMDNMRKKSIIGFADITSELPTKDETSTITFQNFLLQQTNANKAPLFHSVESRGKNGFLVVYNQNLYHDVETFFTSEIHDAMCERFPDDFTMDYFNKVNQNKEIDLTEDNSAISGFSAAESYYQDVTSSISEIRISENNSSAKSNQHAIRQGNLQPKNRKNNTLAYSDDLSSLGSNSAQQQSRPNAWQTPLQFNSNSSTTPTSKTADDDSASIASLRSDVQLWFTQLKNDSQKEWEKKFATIDYLKEKLIEVSKSNERLHDNLKTIQEENRSMIQNLIQNNLMELIDQSVSNHAKMQQLDSPISSPHRKQQKMTPTGKHANQPTTQKSIEDYINNSNSKSDLSVSSTDSPSSGHSL